MIISVGQVYGDVLYYGTSLFDISYCRPEGYYFWFYYFTFNFIWMVAGCCKYYHNVFVGSDTNRSQTILIRALLRYGKRLKSSEILRPREKVNDTTFNLNRTGGI